MEKISTRSSTQAASDRTGEPSEAFLESLTRDAVEQIESLQADERIVTISSVSDDLAEQGPRNAKRQP